MTNDKEFIDLVREARPRPATVAVVLGSGWKPAAERVRVVRQLSFSQIPNFAGPSVPGHEGRLILGEWAGRRVLVFSGRLHRYEGHSWDTILRPVHLAAELGASIFLSTNAAGGIQEALTPGRVMAATDHLDWTRPRCWRQAGPGALGPPRPRPYSARLLELLQHSAAQSGLELHRGVYAQVLGPCYETPAEIRALRCWGADAVGMSTAREIEAAREMGLACAALSCITNRAAGLGSGILHHEDVLAVAAAHLGPRLALLEDFIRAAGPLATAEG